MPKSKDTKVNKPSLKPRITEKAVLGADKAGVYVFNVARNATRRSVSDTIKKEYKVTPESVHLLAIPKKRIFFRGHKGVKGGGKKAYVYLKKGDKINII